MKAHKFLSMLAIGSILLISCSKDDDGSAPINEEELITTLIVKLKSTTGTVILKVYDEDGSDGPAQPAVTITGGNLKATTTYSGSIELLNESVNPAENINDEIKEEADKHQFFFESKDGLNTTTAYKDTEGAYITNGNDNPVGLLFELTTGEASTGIFTVTLRHEPKKPNNGLADAGGNTDLAQAFNLTIE